MVGLDSRVPVIPASPSMFHADPIGKGQGAILNYDAERKRVQREWRVERSCGGVRLVVLFATGAGPDESRRRRTALVTGNTLARPLLSRQRSTIGGKEGKVEYAGAAPPV